MFWFIAIAIGVLATGIMTWPMLRQGSSSRYYGLAMVLLVPIISVFMYQQVGSPEGIDVTGIPQQQPQQPQGDHAAGAGQMSDMVGQLERRLQDNPADVQGWVLLGRSYKTIQKFAEAETALVRAIQLAPNDPLIMVELAEAKMYASGNPVIDEEAKGMLERALLLDPDQQKGLWLLGMAASQSGNLAQAVDLWERLAAQMDPSSPVVASLTDQIAQARARMGTEPEAEQMGVEPETAWPGIEIEVTVSDPDYETPPGAVLFVVARNLQAPGPPVGVRRIFNPVFPLSINLTDSDSMVAQSPVSAVESLQLVARLSMTGSVVPGAQDLSSTALNMEGGSTQAVELTLAVPAP